MKIIKFNIYPNSSFVSFPKGDMIFGHFAFHLFLEKNKILENYLKDKPKIIFSDFLPDNLLYKPALPLKEFGIKEEDKKDFRKKSWIKISDLQNGNFSNCEDVDFYKKERVIRNSINRITFTTDDNFTPYSIEEIFFNKKPVLYVMYDEKFFKEDYIETILRKIGKNGFGKKSSIGKGQFDIEIDKKFNGFKNIETDTYLTISPTILNNLTQIKKAYYNTFNRFGKYAYSNKPFKKPVLMVDSGAVIQTKTSENTEYIGKAFSNGEKSFLQGYSILVPLRKWE
jgi:CRISPR type III-A-associated RAMP protein Csm4